MPLGIKILYYYYDFIHLRITSVITQNSFTFKCLCCSTTALQRHYGILEALALGEDEMPDIKDETLPDEEGLSRLFFCLSIYMRAKLYTPFLFEIGNLVGDFTLPKQGTERWKHNLLNV